LFNQKGKPMSLFSKIVSGMLLVNGFALAGNSLLLEGGMNLSSFTYSETMPSSIKKSMRTGFNVGAELEIAASPMFSIVPGVFLETRGQVLKPTDEEFEGEKAEFKFMYLEVPVLAQVNIPAGSGFFNIFAGPELGILLSAKMKVTGASEQDMKKEVEPIDFGIHFGLGFEFPVGPGAIAIRPGYSVGLTNINKEPEPDPDFPDDPEEPEVKIKNTNIKLAIAYKISL
jgi:hypothetical protein